MLAFFAYTQSCNRSSEIFKSSLSCQLHHTEKCLSIRSSSVEISIHGQFFSFVTSELYVYDYVRDIDVQAGETVIIAPATGSFGGAAVLVALAMGARVIAMGRNLEAPRDVAVTSERIEAVPITGVMQIAAEALRRCGPADAFFDISPPEAAKSTHIRSAILALKHSGRVSLMGGIPEDISLPYSMIMHRSLQLRGKWMYERNDIAALVKMI